MVLVDVCWAGELDGVVGAVLVSAALVSITSFPTRP